MKKILLTICLAAALIAGSVFGTSAFADVSLEDCDRCFQATVNALLDSDDVDGNTVSATRKPVYDIALEHLGYVYEFEIASGDGYAIIICDDGNYVAQEFMPNSPSPYAEVGERELCVFVNTMSYYKAVGGKIYDIAANCEIPAETVAFLTENAVFYKNTSPQDPEYVTVKVEYESMSFDTYAMAFRTPIYYGSGLTGGCAAVAGGNIIGYFDRYYEDLIPNHDAGYYVSGYYIYNFVDTYVTQTINTLYSDMNGTANGISENNFKSGLKAYCSRKGLNCDFTSLMSSGKLNYSSVISSMNSDKPVALFLNTYNVCDINNLDKSDVFQYTKYFGNHVMVGFGHREINYTLSDGSTSNYRFIYVSTGWANPKDAYFNIDYCTNIISSYGVYVH